MPYGKAKKAKVKKPEKQQSFSNKARTFLGLKPLPEVSAKAKKARDQGFVGSKKRK